MKNETDQHSLARDRERIKDLLGGHAATPAEISAIIPILEQLNDWVAPQPSIEDNQRLLSRLAILLPTSSPTRQAMALRPQTLVAELGRLIAITRTQVSIFHPAFWLSSAAIILLGMIFMFDTRGLNQIIFLQALGPLLSYIGTANAFRGISKGMLEFELACPVSPRQLTIARLIIVLSYDISLGLMLSALLWSRGGESFLLLTLHWLTPLLLAAGLTLLLSLRMSIKLAGGLVYNAWLTFLAISWLSGNALERLNEFSRLEMLLGLAGIITLGIAIYYRRSPGIPNRFEFM